MEITFYVKNGYIEVRKDTGESYQMFATSGNGACMNQPTDSCMQAKRIGAIPLGLYHISPMEASNPGTLRDLIRNKLGDWGDWRIPIKSDSGTNTFGRGGFFIHGGSAPGSAGCIDIGGGEHGSTQTDRLFNDIKRSVGFVKLRVVK